MLFLLLASAALTVRAGGVDLPARLHFSAEVVIDASGNAVLGEIRGAKGALADALRTQVQAKRFEPARVDGRAVASATHLTAAAVMTEDTDGSVRVRVEDIRTGPASRKVVPPMYPAEMARHDVAGSALVVFSISDEGKPQDVRLVEVTDTRIVASLEKVVKHWRFDPEMIDGRASREMVAMPVWFYPYRKRGEVAKPVFSCPAAGGRPHVQEGFDGCLDRIEVTYHK